MARALERVECLIVGAGVVGMATARALALRGREVLVCEREGAVGQGTTSRNSEIIHAGLYYKPGSLKAKLCLQGREALYQYCSERGVQHNRCGKLVVASTEGQLPALRNLHERAIANGVVDVRLVSPEEAKEMEPEVVCKEALLSPSSGILDSHALMRSLQGDAEARGAVVALRSPVRGAKVAAEGGIVASVDGMDIGCRALVNCAGLSAIDLAASVQGSTPSSVPEAFFAKGNYFRYAGAHPFRRLVYPLPEPNYAGLGVHVTIDLAGKIRFGPDVEWVSRSESTDDADGFDYRVDPTRSEAFAESIRRYWPQVDESKLVPDYSGIRPKLRGPKGSLPSKPGKGDFDIQGSEAHGVIGLVNLMGLESPGLTASLAIAEHVADMLESDLKHR
ncbi:unnamed protein product [Ascophyllum nodosum]